MAKKPEEKIDANAWMNTYSDMVTLLLCFFAVMLSMSTTSEAKFEAFVNSLQMQGADIVAMEPAGDAASNEEIVEGSIDELYAYIKQYIDENGKADQISVSKDKDIMYIRFQNDMFFEPDRYVLRSDSVESVNFIAQGLKMFESGIRTINVCGHTAKTDRVNSGISDWRLSGERASTIAIVLEDTAGITEEKIQVTGYGSNYPVANNDTEEGRRLNRRVELIVIGNSSSSQADLYQGMTSEYGGVQQSGNLEGALLGGEDETQDSGNRLEEIPLSGQSIDAATTSVPSDGSDANTGGVQTDVSPYDE